MMAVSGSKVAPREYLAFISYRHADNKQQGRQWASWLHQALETYEVPADLVGKTNSRGEVIPERIYPIFRDEEELPAHADLANSITGALANSRLLVVLCSPNAVASSYVADEIRYFKQLGHSDRIIAAMIDGEPNASWDQAKQAAGVPAEAECFPLPLQFVVDEQGQLTDKRAEPIAADFRVNIEGKTEQGWTNIEALRLHLKANTALTELQIKTTLANYQQQQQLMLLKIIAGILGVPLGELTKRDQAYQLELQRKKAKRLRQWLSGVVALAIVATGAGIYAWQQRAEAIAQRDKAETAKATAETAHGLALMEKAERAFELKLNNEGQVYAAHALARLHGKSFEKQTADQIASLVGQRITHPGVELISSLRGHMDAIDGLVYSPDGKVLASLGRDKTIHLWDIASGESINTLRLNGESFSGLTYSPDGKTLAVVVEDPPSSEDNTVVLWDTASAESIATLRAHNGNISTFAFSPDGKTCASGSDDKTIRLWDTVSGDTLFILRGHKDSIRTLTYSPDGKTLASSSYDATLRLWDAISGELIATLSSSILSNFIYSPDGKTLVSEGGDSSILIWDAASGELITTLRGHEKRISSFAYSSDGKTLASASYDGTVRLWDTASGEFRIIGHEVSVGNLVFLLSGKILASADNEAIRFWDTVSGNLIGILRENESRIWPITFSSGGESFALAVGNIIRLWDVSSLESITLRGGRGLIGSLAYSPDGKSLASGGYRETIRLWNTVNGKLLYDHLGHEDSILSLAYSPDGKVLASGGLIDTHLHLWNAVSGEPISTLSEEVANTNVPDWLIESETEAFGHKRFVTSLAYSPDGMTLASGSADDTIKLWDVATGKTFATLRGHQEMISSLAYSPDGKILASGSADKTIRLWDAATGKALITLSGHQGRISSLAFSPDGKILASGGDKDKTARLWNVGNGNLMATLSGHDYDVSSLAFSPDGKTLASGGVNVVLLWNVISSTLMATLHGDGVGGYSLAYSPDGKILASGGNQIIRLWSLPSGLPDIDWGEQSVRDESKYGFWLEGIRLVSLEPAMLLREPHNNPSDGFPSANDGT